MTPFAVLDSETPSLCVVIMGPKGVGKSWVAEVLARRFAVHHVDPDVVILGLLARDARPEVNTGWLSQVEAALGQALSQHERISTEATGAWDTDWQLIGDLRSRGVIVRTVWIHAPFDETLARLGSRLGRKVPTTPEEAAWAFTEATKKALDAAFDLVLGSSGGLDEADVIARMRPLLSV